MHAQGIESQMMLNCSSTSPEKMIHTHPTLDMLAGLSIENIFTYRHAGSTIQWFTLQDTPLQQ
jgi:hypothetical protein